MFHGWIENVADEHLARYAPVYVQHVADGDRGMDRPTRVDFDGDWDATNNWDHQERHGTQLPAAAYGAAVLTDTHAYLTYTLFYPRDWADWCVPLICHDNDLETVQVVVDRTHDAVEEVRIKAHLQFSTTRADQLALRDGRPVLRVESGGHGIAACAPDDAACVAQRGRLVYAPDAPPAPPPEHAEGQAVRYELLSLRDTLWARRHATQDRLWHDGTEGPLRYIGKRVGRIGRRLGAAMTGVRYAGQVHPPWSLPAGGVRGDWFFDPAGTGAYAWNPFLDDLRRECGGRACEVTVAASNPLGAAGLLTFWLGAIAVQGHRRRRGRIPTP